MKEILDFIKINPAGNMTVLIDNFDIYRRDIANISVKLMCETNIYAEQVGFIKGNHLQMMGGEFCGNASRAFASLLGFRDESLKDKKIYSITCSGEDKILDVEVRRGKTENTFLAKIKMPSCISISEVNIKNNKNETEKFYLVKFSGIDHFIYEGKTDENEIIELIKKYMMDKNYSAFGIMFFDFLNMKLRPYVYVNGISGVWENSCASGTTALGFYLKKYKNIEKARVDEINGWLEYSFDKNDIYIDGPVEIIAEGKVYI